MAFRFSLALLALPLLAQVDIKQSSDKVTVDINGKPFTEMFIGPDVRKPFLSPLRSATGKIVTRQWPMVQNVEGETRDHPHHQGLWFNHGDVNGIDFWGSSPLAKNDKGAKI